MAARNAEWPSEVITGIYETIRSPELWPRVVEEIGEGLGARCGMMLTPALPGVSAVPLLSYGLDLTPILAAYPRYAGRAEYTNRALATGRCPGAFLVDELMPIEERTGNEFWREVVAPTGLISGVFGMVRLPEENKRPVILNYYRHESEPPFAAGDTDRFEALFPHLRRALSVVLDSPPRRSLTAGAAELYESLGAPTFVLFDDLTLAYRNHAAEVLLDAESSIAVSNNKLSLWDADAQQALEASLSRICRDRWSSSYRIGAEILAHRSSGGAALVLVVTPLGAENPLVGVAEPACCAIMVLEERLRTNGRLPERLRRLYGLTEAETEIAISLASGRSIEELATERGTSLHTVRFQLRAALAKTGARRQSDLSSLVNRLRF